LLTANYEAIKSTWNIHYQNNIQL